MKRFATDRYKDCKRCHRMMGIVLKDDIYHVTCSVDDEDMEKARVPSYCPRKNKDEQITSKLPANKEV